jgi:NAD(P)-dependent dehydrogenase (short-subunit alcohol dehydrogenase family)
LSSDARVAIVTGGGSGIGAATARLLTERGWRVTVTGRRADRLRAVADEIGALASVGDTSDAEDCAHHVEETLSTYGRLNGLVLNAGIVLPGTVEETTPEDWELTLRVNLTGPFLMARAALKHLRAARGAIVTVGSVASTRASARAPAYAASKAGLAMLTGVMAIDHGPQGVRANCVCPGWTRTEMGEREMTDYARANGVSVDDAYRHATQFVPQRREADAGEVAGAIVWLLSEDASYVNGAVVNVDGGTTVVSAGMLPLSMDLGAG